jgi:Fic family protein
MLFTAPRLDESETAVITEIDDLRRRLNYAIGEPRRWQGQLRRNAFAKAIQGSNTIEGINVTVDDAIAAVADEEPQDATPETWLEIRGYREAMTYVLSLAKEAKFTYSCDTVKSLHFMMLNHDLPKDPGKWRPGAILVRNEQSGDIVYEGAPAELVPELMQELVDGLNRADSTPPMVRAAMAHLNLTMIHPFRDGNGRMARCLQSLVLARSYGLSPVFSSIEEYLGRNTRDYYDVLALVGQGKWHPERDARPWIRFCLTAHFRQATTFLRRNERLGSIWGDLEMAAKRNGLHERVVHALADAALGYRVRNPIYRKLADISPALASRDLRALVEGGFLIPVSAKRGRYYVAGPPLVAVRDAHPMQRIVPDPFTAHQPRLPGL